MRRLTVCLLVFALILLWSLPAIAATYDASYFKDHPEFYVVSEEDDAAFVSSVLGASDTSFSHKYDSRFYYSFIYSDVLILDYGMSDCYPVWRTWIAYCADKYQHIKSVTFTIENVDYTFDNIWSADWRCEKEKGGIQEDLLIRYSSENSEFVYKMIEISTAYLNGSGVPKITMTLHGDEDITAELGEGFVRDFAYIAAGYIASDGFDYISRTVGTPLSVH